MTEEEHVVDQADEVAERDGAESRNDTDADRKQREYKESHHAFLRAVVLHA